MGGCVRQVEALEPGEVVKGTCIDLNLFIIGFFQLLECAFVCSGHTYTTLGGEFHASRDTLVTLLDWEDAFSRCVSGH
jgi:hypothetical protein